jgi:hypothetical protein
VSPRLNPVLEVLTWTGVCAYLVFMGWLLLRSVRKDRQREARIARYEAERRRVAETAMTADAEPVPPEYDPLVVSEPKTPQQGEGHA